MADTDEFRLERALAYLAAPHDPAARDAAERERHVSETAARAASAAPRGLLVPSAALGRSLNTGTEAAGGALVGQVPSGFAGALRAATVTGRVGATILAGLTGDASVPTLEDGAVAEWIDEGAPSTGQTPTVGRGVITPKTVAAAIPVSRRLLLQAQPDVAEVVRADLIAALGAEVDTAALGASADAGAPSGLRQALDAGKTTFGGATPTGAEVMALEQAALDGLADDNGVTFVAAPSMMANLKLTELVTGAGSPMVAHDGQIADRRALVTPAWPDGELIVGGWRDLVIAQFGGVDMRLDRGTGAASDTVFLRAFADVGFLVRRTAPFAYGVAP